MTREEKLVTLFNTNFWKFWIRTPICWAWTPFPSFRQVPEFWEIKSYHWSSQHWPIAGVEDRERGWWMVIAKFTRAPWRGEGFLKESMLGEESRYWPKTYVLFFRPYQRQLQRLHLADLIEKAALPTPHLVHSLKGVTVPYSYAYLYSFILSQVHKITEAFFWGFFDCKTISMSVGIHLIFYRCHSMWGWHRGWRDEIRMSWCFLWFSLLFMLL